MNIAVRSALCIIALGLLVAMPANAQRTTFTYQGYLEEAGAPVQGDKDLRFALYDSKSAGSQIGQTVTKQDVALTDGVFSVELDFGAQFAGGTRYLAVSVRDASSSSSFTDLSPREAIRPAPIASALPNVTVDGSGNVGIGTTSPGSRLTVDGSIEATSGGVTLPDGTVLQGSDDLGAGGDITAVNTTGALKGGGTSGDLTLHLRQNCSDGQILRWDADAWYCGSDRVGGIPTTGSGAYDLSNDEGVLASGTDGTGSIPASGAGTRMMWYPGKAAFRAGDVTGAAWDDANVGKWSVAFGFDTKASGVNAAALGYETTATGDDATALGDGTTASGEQTTVMGRLTTAATPNSLSFGTCNSANGSSDNSLLVAGNGPISDVGFQDPFCLEFSDAFVLKQDGDLAVGPSDPQNVRLHVTKDKANAGVSDSPGGNMVLFENTNDGDKPDVLGLQAGPSSPGSGVTYISFYTRSGSSIGAIEGNGSGGINLRTSGSDYAEELPLHPGAASASPKDLVAVRGGEVHLDTDGARRLMIVTDRAAVTGNAHADASRPRVPVAFVGQVPVEVRGSVAVGDLIVASGRDDGTAQAVAPNNWNPAEHGPVAGQAWTAKPSGGLGPVTVAVGLGNSDAVARRLTQQQRQIETLQQRVNELESLRKRLDRIEERLEQDTPPASTTSGSTGDR